MFDDKPEMISFSNETFERFLGGGLLYGTLNLFERKGPGSLILDDVIFKSLISATLTSTGGAVIYANFNNLKPIDKATLITQLPTPKKVNPQILYKDIRGRRHLQRIKIAWRYATMNQTPSNLDPSTDQIDFGNSLDKPDDSRLIVINLSNYTPSSFLTTLNEAVEKLKKINVKSIRIIIQDVLHPFSPLGRVQQFIKLLYLLRALSRSLPKGVVIVNLDTDLCYKYEIHRNHIYNMADGVATFFSYETGQNVVTGYKNFDGTMDYPKVPKINSYGFHFQRELSDWGYRFTKNQRYFVVDELSLPPSKGDDRKTEPKKTAAIEVTGIGLNRPLEQVTPLEDFKEVAGDVLAKRL